MNLKSNFKDFERIYAIYFALASYIFFIDDFFVWWLISFLLDMCYIVMLLTLNKRRAKQADKVFNELRKYKNILCRGLVGSNRKGAWMFLTENTLDIYFDKIDINGKKAVIALKDITNVTYKGKTTLNISISGKTYKFSVCRAPIWHKMINKQILNCKTNTSADAQAQSNSQHTEKARFCGYCGKKIEENMAFCPNCGRPTGKQKVYRNNTHNFTDNTDKKIVTIKLVSVATVLSTLFLDMFRTVVSNSEIDKYGEIIKYPLKTVIHKSGITTVYNDYDFPFINIVFILLLIMSILIFAFTHFRTYNFVIACSLLNICILAAGFVVYAYLMYQAFNSPKFTFENGISFISLPGIGWVVNFVLTVIIMFFAIFALPNKKKLKA